MSCKAKKKLTKKELKAMNHAKLMSNKGAGGGGGHQPVAGYDNVIQLNTGQNSDQKKKAA